MTKKKRVVKALSEREKKIAQHAFCLAKNWLYPESVQFDYMYDKPKIYELCAKALTPKRKEK